MSYALVTGSSSGIGRCYARELASRGYNIIAVSNQPDELEASAAELRHDYHVEAHAIECDLSRPEAANELYARCRTEGWVVDILVCNAGMLLFSTLTNTPTERLTRIIELHCTTTTLLCRLFGEEMKLRSSGRILIMSSATAWLPYPTISHYAATKAYLRTFGFALWYELHRYGVGVTVVLPGAVDTSFYNLSPTLRRLFVAIGIMQRPETIARRGVRAMMRGRRRLTPGLFTRLVVVICSLLPARLFELLLHIGPIRRLLERV